MIAVATQIEFVLIAPRRVVCDALHSRPVTEVVLAHVMHGLCDNFRFLAI